MIYLSKLGVSFIGLGFVLYLVALQSSSGLLFLVLGILAGCYLVNLVSAWRAARHLDLRPPANMTGREGEAITGTWEVANTTRETLGLTEARSPWGMLFRIGALAGGECIHITPDLLTLPKRGVYPFNSLSLVSSYPFGMIRCTRKLEVSGEFIVYPAVYRCQVPLAAGFEPTVGGKFTGLHRSASGDSFHGVRPFQSSDPVRLIHWASSSKGLGLMVKEFDEELSGRVSIVMDAEGARDAEGNLLIDWAARAAASLVLAALDASHQIEYINLGNLELLSVPPFADGSVVMDSLARLTPVEDSLTRSRLQAALAKLPVKSSVCLVLTSYNADVESFMNRDLPADRRKAELYLPESWREAVADRHVRALFFGPSSLENE